MATVVAAAAAAAAAMVAMEAVVDSAPWLRR